MWVSPPAGAVQPGLGMLLGSCATTAALISSGAHDGSLSNRTNFAFAFDEVSRTEMVHVRCPASAASSKSLIPIEMTGSATMFHGVDFTVKLCVVGGSGVCCWAESVSECV